MPNYIRDAGTAFTPRGAETIYSILDIELDDDLILYVFPGSLSPNDIWLKYHKQNLRVRVLKHFLVVNEMEDRNHPNSIKIKCICGKALRLRLVGGQYQDTWQKDCACGRKWQLEDYSEDLESEDDQHGTNNL